MTRPARQYRHETEWEPRRPQPVEDLPLFATPVREMARRTDPATSKAAAIGIADKLSELQERVYRAYVERGPMTGKELEALPELADLGFSTARKRVGELASRGWLRATGDVREGCQVYEVAK